jgi:LuxR family maltose regulon positive regulatory protein
MAPRLPATPIQRGELFIRLDAGLARKVILVSAPTGFGKTTLIRMWIAQRDFPFAWLTLDEHDNDPVRFWTYVCSALRTVDPSLGKASLSRLASPQPPTFESLLTPSSTTWHA